MKVELEIPNSISVTSRESTVALNLTKLSPELLAQGLVHGFVQKVSDAAAGAAKGAETEAAMAKVVANLEAGHWGRTREGGITPLVVEVRKIVRALVLAKNAKALDGIDKADVAKWLDARLAAQPEKTQKAITLKAQALIDAREKAKKEAADLAGDFTL